MNPMKNKILAGLLVCFTTGFVCAFAEDNPAQAAARAALMKKLFEPDHPQPPPATNWDSATVLPPANFPNTKPQIKTAATNTAPPAIAATPFKPAPAPTNPIPPQAAPPKPASAVPAASGSKPALAVPAALSVPPPAKLKTDLVPAQPVYNLVTLTGAIYKNVQVERVETNAIVISYTPARGGMAMTRVYFDELSAEEREQYEKKK
jgi:hypothetical protein